METLFITGGTGFLGSYVVTDLLDAHPDILLLILTRAKDDAAAREKLWRSLQLHLSPERFNAAMKQIEVVQGDLHAPNLGIDPKTYERLTKTVDSVLHIAASLNRKSAKACLNSNLRGTLSVIKLARAIQDTKPGGLRRYSHVSTVAVAGHRDSEHILEDESIEWDRSDYDPYGRTKKFCEHMAHELLPDVQKTILRPSTVMGDSRFAETTQFDMVRAFCTFVDLPLIPLDPNGRMDIVNADWVGHAIAKIHMLETPKHEIYHLSAGAASLPLHVIADAMAASTGKKRRFAPWLEGTFATTANLLASSKRKNIATLVGSLMKVFLPYVSYDTVFDNSRAVDAVGAAPTPFSAYCGDLYRFAKRVNFEFPYEPLPRTLESTSTDPNSQAAA